ncbi:DUF1569 domain-containing protein [Flavobacterium sp.]|uniref:DUF1569 domain-containing protein n=1 Tax=Flavobacterium sp. TaxID=239 RepID=UPI0039E34395
MNIFNQEDNLKLQSRLQNLTSETTPLWGKMNASQMLLHCQKPLDVADGKLILPRSLVGFLFGKMAKKSFLKSEEFQKNLPTAPEFKIQTSPEFEKEKEVLVELVKKFAAMGPKVIVNKKHPFFGTMTDDEWGVLQFKHLDHHLRQFGV